MTNIFPASTWPRVLSGSLGWRLSLSQRTSMGTPWSLTSRPACWRPVEWRPSAPMVKAARISISPSGVLAPYSLDAAVIFDQAGRFGLHSDVKSGIRLALLDEKIQKIPLGPDRQEF